MLAPGQLSILTEMRIPVWELRGQETASPAPIDAANVNADLNTDFYKPLPAVDCLMVVAEQDDTDEAKRLLHAMLFSIGLTSRNSAIVSPQQLSQLLTTPHQHKVLVAFGEQLVPPALHSQATDRGHIYSSSDSALKIIISLSLTTLLNSPAKKALAWQDLQLLKAAYQPVDMS
jgi:DNA polymerase III psi subunit